MPYEADCMHELRSDTVSVLATYCIIVFMRCCVSTEHMINIEVASAASVETLLNDVWLSVSDNC